MLECASHLHPELLEVFCAGRFTCGKLFLGGFDPGTGESFGIKRVFGQFSVMKHQQVFVALHVKGNLFEFCGVLFAQKPFAEPGVDRLTAVFVVVMVCVNLHLMHLVLRAEVGIDAANRRRFDGGGIPRPISRCRNE